VTYRDQREQCPRCGTDLIDAAIAGTCTQCNGIWLGAGSLHEMINQMQIPPAPVELQLVPHDREQLACPSCKTPMDTRRLYGVDIDLCTKHGIWFDARELAVILVRAAGQNDSSG
jgi:Zn-finger nucleic acid-binding protein